MGVGITALNLGSDERAHIGRYVEVAGGERRRFRAGLIRSDETRSAHAATMAA
jgi:DNA primase catalytic subunit